MSHEFKIHNILLNAFNNRMIQIVKMYISCQTEHGDGVMLITLTDPTKTMNLSYIPIKAIPEQMAPDIETRRRNNHYDKNIIYFVLASPECENIIEIDVRQLGSALVDDSN